MNSKRVWPTALQLYSVRGDMEKDFEGTLRKVKDMGYDGVELVGLYGRPPAEVRKAVTDAGLVPLSAHVPYTEMSADPDKVMQDYAAAAARILRFPIWKRCIGRAMSGFSRCSKP